MARITRVSLTNYRSIGFCDVELQPLTLLVGPNGSGKSNFLDALRFLAHSMHSPLQRVIKARSGIRSILRKLPAGRLASSFTISVNFELDGLLTGMYSLTVGEGRDGAGVIEDERCQMGEQGFAAGSKSIKLSGGMTASFTSDRPALVYFGTFQQFDPVFNLIAGLTFYSPNPGRMRSPTSSGPGTVLSRNAENAADVLDRIKRTQPEVMARIRSYLTAFNPEFSDITATEREEYRWLTFTPASNPSEWEIKGSDVSDGTLRALGILLAIFQSSTSSPPVSLVGLEEPESNLHPAAAGVLLDALQEASERVPIVASTHSADLLDRKGMPASALLAVALHDGETLIGPLNDSGKAILRRNLYTAGELLRNNHLAPSVEPSHR